MKKNLFHMLFNQCLLKYAQETHQEEDPRRPMRLLRYQNYETLCLSCFEALTACQYEFRGHLKGNLKILFAADLYAVIDKFLGLSGLWF